MTAESHHHGKGNISKREILKGIIRMRQYIARYHYNTVKVDSLHTQRLHTGYRGMRTILEADVRFAQLLHSIATNTIISRNNVKSSPTVCSHNTV